MERAALRHLPVLYHPLCTICNYSVVLVSACLFDDQCGIG